MAKSWWNPFDGDVIPGLNVRNVGKQAKSFVGAAPKGDYDLFDNWTVSNRKGQKNAIPGSNFGKVTNPGKGSGGGPSGPTDIAEISQIQGGGSPISSYDPVAAASAARIARDNAEKQRLKGEGMSSLDELYSLYDQIIARIREQGGDATQRINKDFDEKVAANIDDMNTGMYDTDAANAANNLADSSWASFDRGKVRAAAEANTRTLNNAREGSLSEVGQMVAGDTAKYKADQDGINRTRQALSGSDNLDEIRSTANTLDSNKRGAQADMAKYGKTGEFAQKANSIGKYDTTKLEQTLQSVVQNASATPATKAGAINDLLNGTQLEDSEKERLKNKYTQTV